MTNSDLTPPPPNRPSTAKWMAIGCGGCLGLSLLFFFGIGLLITRTVRLAVGPNQVEIDEQALFTYAMPQESRGIFDLNMLGIQVIQVATTDSPPTVLLTMGQLPRYLQDRQAQETFVESLQERIAVEGNYQLAAERVEERQLCDQPVAVTMQAGQFDDGQTIREAASMLAFVEYDNGARFAWILAHGDTPQATADQVFASLDCR
jgi:hypothetical protein